MKASSSASRSPSRRSSSLRRCAAGWRGRPTRTERVPRLVLVTDRHAAEGRDLLAVIAAALDAGLPAVQLRDRDLPGRPLLVLAERLRRLTREGVLERRQYQERPARYEYLLTDKGRDFFPVIAAIVRWGDRWLHGRKGAPFRPAHRRCRQTKIGAVRWPE